MRSWSSPTRLETAWLRGVLEGRGSSETRRGNAFACLAPWQASACLAASRGTLRAILAKLKVRVPPKKKRKERDWEPETARTARTAFEISCARRRGYSLAVAGIASPRAPGKKQSAGAAPAAVRTRRFRMSSPDESVSEASSASGGWISRSSGSRPKSAGKPEARARSSLASPTSDPSVSDDDHAEGPYAPGASGSERSDSEADGGQASVPASARKQRTAGSSRAVPTRTEVSACTALEAARNPPKLGPNGRGVDLRDLASVKQRRPKTGDASSNSDGEEKKGGREHRPKPAKKGNSAPRVKTLVGGMRKRSKPAGTSLGPRRVPAKRLKIGLSPGTESNQGRAGPDSSARTTHSKGKSSKPLAERRDPGFPVDAAATPTKPSSSPHKGLPESPLPTTTMRKRVPARRPAPDEASSPRSRKRTASKKDPKARAEESSPANTVAGRSVSSRCDIPETDDSSGEEEYEQAPTQRKAQETARPQPANGRSRRSGTRPAPESPSSERSSDSLPSEDESADDESADDESAKDGECEPPVRSPSARATVAETPRAIACSSADSVSLAYIYEMRALDGGCVLSPADSASVFVAGKVRRGAAMLVAIARGIPVVDRDWLVKCSKAESWLDWEDSELHPGSRLSMARKSDAKSPGLLRGMNIRLDEDLRVDYAHLHRIIVESGGNVVSSNETVVIAGEDCEDQNSVSLKWLGDSVEQQKVLPFANYAVGR